MQYKLDKYKIIYNIDYAYLAKYTGKEFYEI